jgi:hypothetical protein
MAVNDGSQAFQDFAGGLKEFRLAGISAGDGFENFCDICVHLLRFNSGVWCGQTQHPFAASATH